MILPGQLRTQYCQCWGGVESERVSVDIDNNLYFSTETSCDIL